MSSLGFESGRVTSGISDLDKSDDIATLDDGDVPFEAPAGQQPARPAPKINRKRKKKRTPLIALLAIVYAIGAVGIGAVDEGGFYLLAWLVSVPLLYALGRTLRSRI